MSKDGRLSGRRLQARRALALRMYGTRCWLCGEDVLVDAHWLHPLSYQLEHRIPLHHGGDEHDPNNWAIAHRHCNLSKGSKLIGYPRNPSRQW